MYYLSEDRFVIIINSPYPDEMPPHATFYLGLQCLQRYPFKFFQSSKCFNNESFAEYDFRFMQAFGKTPNKIMFSMAFQSNVLKVCAHCSREAKCTLYVYSRNAALTRNRFPFNLS